MLRHNIIISTAIAALVSFSASRSSQAAVFGDFIYTDKGTTITIDEHWNYEKATPVVLPSTIDGKPVTVIGRRAFWRSHSIPAVTIPAGVTTVEAEAFWGCGSMASITFGSGLVSIGDKAFWACGSLASVQFPEGLTTIQPSTFWGCPKLKTIQLPSTLTHAPGAFENSGLQTATLAPGTKAVPDSIFYACRNLVSVSIPSSVTEIHDFAFSDCNSLKTVELPAGLTRIGNNSFSSCFRFQEVSIPASVISIGDYAFSETRISQIFLPKNLGDIGEGAFAGCGSLREVRLPTNLKEVSDKTFLGCALATVVLPEDLTRIGELAFSSCSFDRISLPSSLRQIGASAFQNCDQLRTAVFNGKAPSVKGRVFAGTAKDFTIFLENNATGFTLPRWKGYRTSQPQPEISVTSADGTDLAIGGSESLGSGIVGKKGSARKIIVINTGIRPLTGLQAFVSGGDSSDFTVIPLKKDSIAPGKSIAIAVSFSPTKGGKRHTQLVIRSNDNNEGNYTINLTGTGLKEK